MADEERILKIRIQYINEATASATEAKAGADRVATGLRTVEQSAASATNQLRQLRRAGQELTQLGTTLGFAGAALTGPLVAAAKAWVDANKQSTSTSIQWVAATDRIQASYLRVGQVAAQQLLPSLKSAADLSDKLASFVDRNPGVVKAALGIGATLVASGSALVAAGVLVRSVADVALLINTFGGGAATGASVAGAGSAAGALTGGTGLVLGGGALLGGTAIGSTLIGAQVAGLVLAALRSQRPDLFVPNHQQLNTLSLIQQAQGGEPIAGTPQAQQQISYWEQMVTWLAQIAANTSRINSQGGVGSVPYGPLVPPAINVGTYDRDEQSRARDIERRQARAAALPAYIQYQANINAANSDYSAQYNDLQNSYTQSSTRADMAYSQSRFRELRDFNENEAQIEKAYNNARLTQLRDFNEHEAQAQKAFDESQAKAQDQHNLDDARAAQDHADELKQLSDDHEQRVRDLAAAGDALGFEKEKQNYAKQVADSNANYDKDKKRRDEDYARQKEDAKQQFDEQRAQDQANFKEQQDDAQKAYEDEKTQRDQQFQQQRTDEQNDYNDLKRQRESDHQDQLDQLSQHYTDLKNQITAAFTAQLNAIDPILTGMTKLVQQKGQDASDEFGKFLDGLTSQANGGPGYCQPGYHWDPNKKACVLNPPHAGGGGFYAAGGYADYGQYTLGEAGREFVLNSLTTRTLEGRLGGPLSQGSLINMPLGGLTVNGAGGAALIAQLVGMFEGVVTGAVNQLADQVGG